MPDPFSTPDHASAHSPAMSLESGLPTAPPRPRVHVRTIPIWAPTPGVPFPARVLAWAFAALVIFTIILTFLLSRPPDIPPMPDQWLEFKASHGTIPYPAGWTTHSKREHGLERFAVDLPPGRGVHIDCSIQTLPAQADAMIIEQFAKNVDDYLSSRFHDFQPIEDVNPSGTSDVEQPFTFRSPDGEIQLAGVWMLRTHEDKAFLLIAICHREAFPVVRQIANHVVAFSTLN